jgi:hypothetical protein
MGIPEPGAISDSEPINESHLQELTVRPYAFAGCTMNPVFATVDFQRNDSVEF